MSSNPYRAVAVVLALLLAAMLPGPVAAEQLAAKTSGKTVTISGWATFSGATVAAKTDSAKDGSAIANDAGGQITKGELLYRPEVEDFFLRLNVTRIPSAGIGLTGVSTAGDPRTLYGFRFSAQGVPYEIRVHRGGSVSANRTPLEPAFGLFKCTEVVCTEVAELRGGYGTTGERITVSLPLSVLKKDGAKAGEGHWMSELYAYTAVGTYLTGHGPSPVIMDDVRLTKASRVYIPRKSVTVTVKGVGKKASLSKGHFNVAFPKSMFSTTQSTPVKTKACLGSRCTTQSYTVRP